MQSRIHIKLFASLKKYLPDDSGQIPITPGMTVGEVVHRLGIPVNEAKLIFIDSKQGSLSTPLQGDEKVGIFPPVGGG